MPRVLLVDQDSGHAGRLAALLGQRGLAVEVESSSLEAVGRLRERIPSFELVLVAASGMLEPWIGILRALVRASRQSCMCVSPLFLFIARTNCSPHTRLQIEHLGARYVRER